MGPSTEIGPLAGAGNGIPIVVTVRGVTPGYLILKHTQSSVRDSPRALVWDLNGVFSNFLGKIKPKMLNLLLCALRDIRRNFEQMLNAQVSEYRSAV